MQVNERAHVQAYKHAKIQSTKPISSQYWTKGAFWYRRENALNRSYLPPRQGPLSTPPSSWAENTYIFGSTPSLHYRNSIPRSNPDLTGNLKYPEKLNGKKLTGIFLELHSWNLTNNFQDLILKKFLRIDFYPRVFVANLYSSN